MFSIFLEFESVSISLKTDLRRSRGDFTNFGSKGRKKGKELKLELKSSYPATFNKLARDFHVVEESGGGEKKKKIKREKKAGPFTRESGRKIC